MILFQIKKTSKDLLKTRLFEIRVQANISFRLCYTQHIPFTFELGLGLLTISYEVWRS
jgi:hypothetical protein